jgi:hypothetical protein
MTQLYLRQGNSTIITDVISGLSSLSGYIGKLYIYTKEGTEVDIITGTISGLTLTYVINNEDSKTYPIGLHDYECILFDTSDHVHTDAAGLFLIEKSLRNDPS